MFLSKEKDITSSTSYSCQMWRQEENGKKRQDMLFLSKHQLGICFHWAKWIKHVTWSQYPSLCKEISTKGWNNCILSKIVDKICTTLFLFVFVGKKLLYTSNNCISSNIVDRVCMTFFLFVFVGKKIITH